MNRARTAGAATEALFAAARDGDRDTVERLLAEGTDPNARNDVGETVLHIAVGAGQAAAAACLLAYGADHHLTDRGGRSPLSLDFTDLASLHAIRQHYRRFRPGRSLPDLPETSAVRHWSDQLSRDGFLKLSGLIRPDELMAMQQDFAGFVQHLDELVARGQGIYKRYDEEEHWWPEDRAYVCNNAFKYSRQLVRFCCRPDLLQLARQYLGKTGHISRGVAMRYLPHEESTNDMFGWHHDLEEQRLKIMVLLTDVGEDGQSMSYVLGSHRLLHPLEMFKKNACSLEYCQTHLPQIDIVRTIGVAGDVFLFDSNGAHRGVRRPNGPVRDAFFIEFSTERSRTWGADIDPVWLREPPLAGPNPFDWMLAVETKRWHQQVIRKAPSWIENLPNPDTWLS